MDDWGARLLAAGRSAAEAIERVAVPLYAAVILAFVVVFFAAAHFFTVEADEAWILLSTMHAFGIPLPSTDALASPTLTSGGAHLVLHGALSWLTSSIFVHRLISLLFTVMLLGTVFRALKSMGRSNPTAMAGTALFAAVPGAIFQASLATPEIIATLLLIWGCLHWVGRGQSANRQAIVSGLLFGLACATRVNCVIALPAILIYAALSGTDVRARLIRAILTVGTAAAIMVLAMAAYYAAAQTGNASQAQSFFAQSAGVTGAKSPTHIIWSFVIADRIMPVWLIGAIAGGFFITAARGSESIAEINATRLSAILLLVGLGGLAAWIWKAPIPHLRYLWPAIPCLWLAGIIQLTQPAITRSREYGALAFHLLVLAVCGSAIAADALAVANGESLTLVYQANGTSPFRLPNGSLHAGRDQRSLASFVANQPRETEFYGLIPANSYPITLLSRRAIAPVQTMAPNGPRFLILNSADATVWHPDAAFLEWMRGSTVPAFVSGDFAALRIKDGAALPPPPHMMWVGANDLVGQPS